MLHLLYLFLIKVHINVYSRVGGVTYSITEGGKQKAVYDESFGAPFCAFIGNECSLMDLLNGRGTMEGGNEPNPSNTSFQPSTLPSLTPTKRLSTSPSESPSKRPVLSAFDVDADNNKKRAMRWCQETVMRVFDDV